MSIDVIIPIYKPGQELLVLLQKLNSQTVPVGQIILMNTEEKYFENLVSGTRFFECFENVKVYHLSKREFDHGATRNRGIMHSKADICICMTQDAIPADEYMIEHLIAHLEGEVAVAYARQIPGKDCSETERITRGFNYPSQSEIKSLRDVERIGIKAFFCSNVCAAYRRDVYDSLGGFDRHSIFNEDMVYASAALKAGFQIAYEADARVIHSHNYTCMQQLHRNFDLGVSHAMHPEVFGQVSSESEGKKLVCFTFDALRKRGKLYCFPYFCMQCAFKYLGYQLGSHYRMLPGQLVHKLTMNKEFWKD